VKGRQLPIMYSDKKHGFSRFRATSAPNTAGGRLGDGIRDQGRQPHLMGWIGDGATAEGDFHSAMTLPRFIRRRLSWRWSITSGRSPASG
jgi:2-oxoisovalerate dehydrogenase E1 component alpha subunit